MIIAAISGISEMTILIFADIFITKFISVTTWVILLSPVIVCVLITIILTLMGIRQFYLNASIALNPKQELKKLRYIMSIHHESGITVYNKKLGDWELDPSLVGGFLNAVQSFSHEIKRVNHETKQSEGMHKMEYKDFEILFEEGKYTLMSLIIDGKESNWLREKLNLFTTEFERKFEERFKNWTSELSVFEKSESLVDRIFELYRLDW